jgi:hypothetical protein
MPNARFQAAGAIGDAAVREWGILADDNKRSLVLLVLNFRVKACILCEDISFLALTNFPETADIA